MTTRLCRPALTLIEAIIAVVILAVAMPALLMATSDAQRRRVDPIMTARARWLAAERLEDVIADRHSASRGYTYIVPGHYPDESPVSGFAGFSRTVSIAETGPSLAGSGTGYKTVTVTITYPGAPGASRSLAISTVLTDYTP